MIGSRWPMFGGALLGVAFLALLGWLIADCSLGTSGTREVVVVDRVYTPSTTSTGVGFDNKGRSIVTTQSTAERWTIVIADDCEVRTESTSREVWALARPGEHMAYLFSVGHWSGHEYTGRVVGPVSWCPIHPVERP